MVARTARRSWNGSIAFTFLALVLLGGAPLLPAEPAPAASPEVYYAHPVVEDGDGVIAPWYRGQNGQLDLRVRIAAELFKRYPWTEAGKAVVPAPHLIYNTHWSISPEGRIAIPPTDEWMCGDLGQRALSIIQGLAAYYRYTGDPMAFAWIPLTADYILDFCLTGPDHPWPRFPVSTPTRGKAYGRADPRVPNQLDLCAMLGTEMIRAFKLTANPRYLEAARHWGEVIAEKCRFDPDLPPWSRYVSPEYMAWSDELAGSITLILEFLDALIETGHTGPDRSLVKARDAGRRFLTDHLLPRWTENEVWGRHYWDWENPVLCGVVPWCCEYFMAHREAFPDWRTDVRNVLSLVFSRNCVSPESLGDIYSGAWAFPETSSCCGTSLSYNQYTYGPAFALYGELAGDEWAREIARRMLIMATYDSLENGVVRDGLRGKVVAAGDWLNLAHPWPLCQSLKALSILGDVLGASRENHILSSTSVVNSVVYGKGRISYCTFDAPRETVDVLRLAFAPRSVEAGGKPLSVRADLAENGYTVKALSGGDSLVSIRHDGLTSVLVEGDDPQEVADDSRLHYAGSWTEEKDEGAFGGALRASGEAGARARFSFKGNQVRLIGRAGPEGGLADVSIDGARQMTLIDCWNPSAKLQQVLYYMNGLPGGRHELLIEARGARNPHSKGDRIWIDAVQSSSAEGDGGFGEGGGPRLAQRMIFGSTGRKDYRDSRGNLWRPGTEFVIRSGTGSDSVKASWWTERRSLHIGNTPDPELYRYGIHGKEFWVNLTVGPGRYRVRLHFADTLTGSVVTAAIDGKEVLREMKVAEAAGGLFRALDREFPGIEPRNGAIQIRFTGSGDREASVQALEVVPEEEAGAGSASDRPRGLKNPFFALCMDTHDAKKRSLAEQADLLKELGYDGAGHLWLDGVAERLKTLERCGLKLFQIYFRVSLDPAQPSYDARVKEVLPALKGRETMLAVLITGGKPSDAALDARAVEIVGEIADMARPWGVRLALYPHAGDWLEKVSDGIRVVKKAGRENVGVMFNLCHWMKADDVEGLRPLLESAMPRLFAVSLNGSDRPSDIKAGKGQWIQPLGSGSFDMLGFLKTLRDLGYRGPVGLQCYGLAGDAREHLARSMAAWRELGERLASQ